MIVSFVHGIPFMSYKSMTMRLSGPGYVRQIGSSSLTYVREEKNGTNSLMHPWESHIVIDF